MDDDVAKHVFWLLRASKSLGRRQPEQHIRTFVRECREIRTRGRRLTDLEIRERCVRALDEAFVDPGPPPPLRGELARFLVDELRVPKDEVNSLMLRALRPSERADRQGELHDLGVDLSKARKTHRRRNRRRRKGRATPV